MALAARNRVEAVNVLHVDYEECTISYYALGARNDLGEPSRTLTQRATNVRCSIDPLVRLPTYISQSGIIQQLEQGLITQSVYLMVLAVAQTIEPGDVVENVDGDTFDILHVVNWRTHAEAFLREIN